MGQAHAHTRSQSFSIWTIDQNEASFTFTVDARRVTQLTPGYPNEKSLTRLLETHLRETLQVRQAGAPCSLETLRVAGEGAPVLSAVGVFRCPQALSAASTTAAIAAFFPISPTHVHIARIVYEETSRDMVLRHGESRVSLDEAAAPAGIFGFVRLGFSHVLSGTDHILFLAALAMAVSSLRMGLLCVTGFTLGHSITLALASLNVIAPNSGLIEALIGFTIAAAALEASVARGLNRRKALSALAVVVLLVVFAPWSPKAPVIAGLSLAAYAAAMAQLPNPMAVRLTPLITALFGLAHGAGFAGALIDLEIVGGSLATALVGFNVGVELAQIVALAGLFFLLATLARLTPAAVSRLTEHATLAALLAAGLFWFAERLWA